MRKLSVDVYADKSRPEGGHAVIRLNGLDTIPDSLTFRLKPLDTAQQAESGWSADERQPLLSRLTAEGAELVIGPDIVENPIFLPGTLTAIEVPTCGVRGEFLWPRIPPLLRPKRRHLIGARATRDVKVEAEEPILFGEAVDASSDRVPEATRDAIVPSESTKAGGNGNATPGAISLVPGSEQLLAPPPSVAEPNTAIEPAEASTATALRGTRAGEAVMSPVVPTNAKPDVVWSKRERATWSGRSVWLAGVAAAAAVAALGVYVIAGSFGRQAAAPGKDGDFISVLSVGTTSPRGTKTRDRTPVELIEAADNLLHAPVGTRDRAEAAFMLRRYLAATMSDERTLWALTQLGSVYAEPDGQRAPDYAKARQLWELSATLGDPVAMCFRAALHEHGLGEPASKQAALQWYLRAKDAGGCQRLDEAIARVRK